MSTREILQDKIAGMNEEQLVKLLIFIENLDKEILPRKKITAESLCGIFHDVADPQKTALEKSAWEQAAIEKYIRFTEETADENS